MAKKVEFSEIDQVKAFIYCVQFGDLGKLELLLKSGLNPNVQNEEGTTALHIAVGSKNIEAVKILLSYGADKTIKNLQGKSPADFNEFFPNVPVWELLNPEHAAEKQGRIIEMETLKSEYLSKYTFDVDKESLKQLATTYTQSDKVEIISNPLMALKYMHGALQYMTLYLLEAKKYKTSLENAQLEIVLENYEPYDPYYSNLASPLTEDQMEEEYQQMILNHQQLAASQPDDDDKWNNDYSANQMLQAISACVFYLRENDVGKLSKLALPSINWKALALFARENQHNAGFVSNFGYSKKIKLVNEALHSILDTGELTEIVNHIELLIKSIENVQGMEAEILQLQKDLRDPATFKEVKKEIPAKIKSLKADITKENMNIIDNYESKLLAALIGVIKDEHSAKCIKSAVTFDQNFDNPENVPVILNSLIKIGEALDDASPKLKSLFNHNAVQNVESVRIILCHHEIPEYSVQIKNLLTNGKPVMVVSGKEVNLMVLIQYWISQSTLIAKFLDEIYDNTSSTTTLWNEIKDMADKYLVSKIASSVKTHNEVDTLSYLESKPHKTINDLTRICELKPKIFEGECEEEKLKLKESMESNFKSTVFKDRIKEKLKKPENSLQKVSEYLKTNKEAYEQAEIKANKTPEEEKVVTNYKNMQTKQELWQEYNKNLKTLEANKDKQIHDMTKWKNTEIDKIISYMLSEYITYAENVKELFEEINTTQPQLAKKNFDECQYLDDEGNWQIDSNKAKTIDSLYFQHSQLEFYQIMVGSIARGILETKDKVEDFGKILPEELCDILKETVIASRSYLAHIGMRREDKSFDEAIDRPKVFFENSQKIIESIQSVTILAKVKETPLTKDLYDFLAIKDGLKKKGINDGNILNTVENEEQLVARLNEINKSNHVYMIPLNVNGIDGSFTGTLHWVGLYITTNENAGISSIKYINPIGQKINQELIDTIFSHTGIVPQDVTEGKGIQFAYVSESGIELKGNTYDCGPLLVQLLVEIFTTDTIQTQPQGYLESILLGQQCRKEQRWDEDQSITGMSAPINSDKMQLPKLLSTTEVESYIDKCISEGDDMIEGSNLLIQKENGENKIVWSNSTGGQNTAEENIILTKLTEAASSFAMDMYNIDHPEQINVIGSDSYIEFGS
jgi:hypothetical protein